MAVKGVANGLTKIIKSGDLGRDWLKNTLKGEHILQFS